MKKGDRVRVKDDCLLCPGDTGTIAGHHSRSGWFAVDLDDHESIQNPVSFADHELEIIS